MTAKPILEIDAKGWQKVQANVPKFRSVLELYQNAKDEKGVSEIKIGLKPVDGRPVVEFFVQDNGPGFSDLSHSYTLFAPSAKLGDPMKNGFMNIGEKSVVVGTLDMTIETTSGTIEFDMEAQTRKEFPRRKLERGTNVFGRLRMTRDELAETNNVLKSLIVPEGISLTVNGEKVTRTEPLHTIKASLPTRLMVDGDLVTRTRETTIELRPSTETGMLFEMGIPVVEHDIVGWDINVGQKCILNKDRDNVTPAYLQTLKVLVLNAIADTLKEDEVSEPWVREAAGDERAEQATVERVMNLRFGEKRVAFSPNDPEANNKAVANGFTLIHGRTLSDGERANAKKFDLLQNSHTLFPTAKPYSNDPTAPPVKVLTTEEMTEGMQNVREYSRWLGQELLGTPIAVRMVSTTNNFVAAFGDCCLDFNVRRLGKSWFEQIGVSQDELIIHEFGHHFSGNHLSSEYYDALCRLGAQMVQLALKDPKRFAKFQKGMQNG